MTTETFNSTTTWECPSGVTSIDVECWGAGGAGAQSNSINGGGGGGGGAYSKKTITVVPSTTYTVTVGAGAIATAGGDTWFSTSGTVLAKGGARAVPLSNSPGAGGLSAAGIGDTKFSGGSGGTADDNEGTSLGGGGGGSGGTASNGNVGGNGFGGGNGNGATAVTDGGAGGNGGKQFNTPPAQSGVAPGGGGGGGYANVPSYAGAAGASGRVILTYADAPVVFEYTGSGLLELGDSFTIKQGFYITSDGLLELGSSANITQGFKVTGDGLLELNSDTILGQGFYITSDGLLELGSSANITQGFKVTADGLLELNSNIILKQGFKYIVDTSIIHLTGSIETDIEEFSSVSPKGNKGTIEMIVNSNGRATYRLTFELRDAVGEIVPMTGANLASERKRQLALQKLQNSLQRQFVRYETYDKLTKTNLKKLLLYKTGSARINVIKTLDLKYKIGLTEIKSHFHY